MLEQSALHGRIFRSEFKEKTLISKPVSIANIAFGPMRPIQIYRISDKEMWVQDKYRGDWYYYKGVWGDKELPLVQMYKGGEIQIADYTDGKGFFYYYGKALYYVDDKEQEEDYFIQNEPSVTYDGIPNTDLMQMPLTMQALDYEPVFSYPEEIKRLLADYPACYVDRYKRPIMAKAGRVYPVAMEKVSTTWENLPAAAYPVVINFASTVYGVADLEPEHTKEDEAHFDKLEGFYEEETPRGGRHKLVIIEEKDYKYRYSPGLEIINQSQVTLYGIRAKWLKDKPAVLDTSVYQTVGHAEHSVTAYLTRPDVSEEVAILRAKAEENLSTATAVALKLYRKDADDSHGEYVVLRTLYQQDIEPYARQFDTGKLPWILEQYASSVIEHRDKHETLRCGLPYLVYLAAIIIGKKCEAKIWDSQNYISFECVRSESMT